MRRDLDYGSEKTNPRGETMQEDLTTRVLRDPRYQELKIRITIVSQTLGQVNVSESMTMW